MSDRPYLSIGEVLGLLLEEFPDVTISKIRFLESQGLIDPERTASGYRKFYDNDVDLLRVILREQRENFLPLRVIRDRLESGAIEDPTGPTTPPRGIRNMQTLDVVEPDDDHQVAPVPASDLRHDEVEHDDTDQPPSSDNGSHPGVAATDHKRDSFPARDLCHLAGLTPTQLAELESYGLLSGKGTGAATLYTAADLAIAEAAAGFMQHGVEARHLRAWRQAAEREASLFEQMILPLLRQRNPKARQQAVATLTTLSSLGAQLRSAIVRSALAHHLDG
ncbi:MAG: transcriptional regulator FtsR [Ilumatobacteraceae bacterium]